eukprot:gene8754-33616_t
MHSRTRSLLKLSIWVALAMQAASIKIVVPPGSFECVAETVEGHHFEVPGGPRLDGRVIVTGKNQYYVPFITIKLMTSTGETIWQKPHVYSESHFNVPARGPGVYKVCFENPYESRTNAIVDLVYFTLAHMRSGGKNVVIPKGTAETRGTEVAHKDHMDEVKRTITGMSEFMQVISGSQSYLKRKLIRHEATMKSNQNRALGYASLEVLVLFLVAAVQVFTIRKFLSKGSRVKISV